MTKTTDSTTSGQPLACPGLHRVWSNKAQRLYIYAWRGGPHIETIQADTKAVAMARLGEVSTAARIAAKWAVIARPRPESGTIRALICDFKGSAAFRGLAPSTQRNWRSHLEAIEDKFGTTSIEAIQKQGARALIKRWHESMAKTPRKADIALTVLTRVFNWALDEERMYRNPATGIARLHKTAGRSQITWTEDEFAALCAAADPHYAQALRFLYLTGMRRGDVIRVTWKDVDREAGLIRWATSKSNRQITARIPITPELGALLDEIAATQAAMKTGKRPSPVTILATIWGTSYKSPESFSQTFIGVRRKAKIKGKHLHDLRGTRATLDFAAGMSDLEAEAKFGWAPGQGAKMRAVYADADTVAIALARTASKK